MAIIQLGCTQTDRKSWYLGWLRPPSEIFNQQIKMYHLSSESLQMGRMAHINTPTCLWAAVQTLICAECGLFFSRGQWQAAVLLTKGLLALVDPGRRASPLAGQPGYEQPVVRSDLSVCANIRQPPFD